MNVRSDCREENEEEEREIRGGAAEE